MIEAKEAWQIIVALMQTRGPMIGDQNGPYISLVNAVQIIESHADGLSLKFVENKRGDLERIIPIFAARETEARDE